MQIDRLAAPLGQPESKVSQSILPAARALESAFLQEMLGAAGLGETREAFGGGAGEEQFASLLRKEQVRMMVDAGGIGLASAIAASLARQAEHG